MALLRQYYTNFTAGELTPLLSSRIDADAYKNAVKTLRNARIRAQGGITRRPGLQYHQTLLNTVYQLEGYIFDENEAYILLFSNGRLDIVDTDNPSVLLQTITSSECEWNNTNLGQLVVSQSGDTMIISHPDFLMKKLTRTSATNFDLEDFEFYINDDIKFTAYHKFAATSTTVTPSTTSGSSVTLTASAATWSTDMLNTYLKLIDSTGAARFFKITGYTSDTVVTGKLNASIANTSAITDWKEEVFSVKRGFARTVIFHDQRLIFGGTRDLPNNIFMSKTGEFFDFEVGTGLDNEGINLEISENQVSEIKALTSLRHLTVFTSEQELYIPTTENKPLTPATITIKKQTSFGSSDTQPQEFDGAVVYLTKTKGAIREFVFSDLSQAYNSDALTILSQDLITDPVDIAAQREAFDQVEGYLYVVNSDGTLPVFMSIRKEKLQGWCKYETDGKFKNIVNVNRTMYCVIERTINGATVTHLEQLSNSSFLDSSIQLTDTTAKANWQAAHLPNTNVFVRNGNYSLGQYTTDGSGNLTLTTTCKEVEIGINYTPKLVTLPPEFQLQDGVSVGQKRRIVRAVLDLNNTLNIKAKGNKVLIRAVNSNFANPPDPITERKEIYLLGWSKDGTVEITSDEPLLLTLNGILLEVEI